MLDTALVQIRYGLSTLFDRRIRLSDVEKLVADVVATTKEFGTLSEEQASQVRPVSLDPGVRRTLDERRLRKAASKACAETIYYQELFDRHGLRSDDVRLDRLAELPVTPKADLKSLPEAFVSRRSSPVFQAFTTATTGSPTSVWFSRFELDFAAALSALGNVSVLGMGSEDVVQISMSSRAALSAYIMMASCRLVGSAAYPLGLIDPDQTLARLASPVHLPGKKPQVSVMTTYPSYLGALVERGEAQGYGPRDFRLELILCGSEILTAGLRRRAESLFGARLVDVYGMTEVFPVNGVVCSQGHLHMNPEMGLVEVLDPICHQPVRPGEVGTMVVTPFSPYRETTLLFRFDTGDLVRRLEKDPVDCELAAQPAMSPILGKISLGTMANGRYVSQRDVLELLHDMPEIPLPTRYAVEPAGDGFDLHVLARKQAPELSRRLEQGSADRALPLRRIRLYDDRGQMPPTVPMRADLREATFGQA